MIIEFASEVSNLAWRDSQSQNGGAIFTLTQWSLMFGSVVFHYQWCILIVMSVKSSFYNEYDIKNNEKHVFWVQRSFPNHHQTFHDRCPEKIGPLPKKSDHWFTRTRPENMGLAPTWWSVMIHLWYIFIVCISWSVYSCYELHNLWSSTYISYEFLNCDEYQEFFRASFAYMTMACNLYKVLSARTTKVVDYEEHLLGKGKYPIQYAKSDDKSSISIRYKRYLDIIDNIPSMSVTYDQFRKDVRRTEQQFLKSSTFSSNKHGEKAHYFDMFNFASWQKLSTDYQARHCAKDCTLCSSVATCPEPVKPVSVPQVESESRKMAHLEKKISQTLSTSIDDDVDFIFRHKMSFSDYEKQRLDCGYISRNESLKNQKRTKIEFLTRTLLAL